MRSADPLLARRCRRRLLFAGQFPEHALEILGLAEIAVDRGEPHIGDVVEIAQMRHHGLADGLGRDLVLAQRLEVAHDLGYRLLDAVGVDIALAQRNLDGAGELVAVEWNAPAIALDDDELAQLHPLERREAEAAGKAQTPPPDRRGILGRTA